MSRPAYSVGLVGAGPICELHVAAVKKLSPGVELVGITDLDQKLSHATAETCGTISFRDLAQLVEAGANVIHVLSPPDTRAKVAMAALELGCHVLIEHPIAETADEARTIGELAEHQGLTVAVDLSRLYDPRVKDVLASVKAGAVGEVVSVEVLRGSSYPPYEGGPLPPWSRDAGAPFRELGTPYLFLIQELLGPIQEIDAAHAALGGDPNLAYDDWRATIRCARGLGQLRLASHTRPMPSQLTIRGANGVLRVDLVATLHGPGASRRLPRAAERLVNALADSIGRWIDVPFGVRKLLPKDGDAHQGLRDLVAAFYRGLAGGEPLPVAVGDVVSVVRWVETIARAAEADHLANLARFPRTDRVPFLVTGASGSLGTAVLERLRADGHRPRAFVRRIPSQPAAGIEYCFGNLGDPVAVDRAVEGAEIVIHCGAAMKGGWPEHRCGTVIGTQNVIAACKTHGVKQLVYISSMSVVDWAGSSGNGPVSETATLEPRPGERGAYTRAKLEAEQLIVAAATNGLPVVILRPGQIFGGGIALISGAVARDAGGRWLILGDGKLSLPLVYIDDVVDAIMKSVEKRLTHGEVIQIIDPDVLTQHEVLALAGGAKPILHVPRRLVFALGKLSEYPLRVLGRQSPVALYRLQSALARLRYDGDLASALLGWHPRVGVREGIKRVTL